MSSRQEEKERRKQERLEREKAEAAAAQRKRLVQIVAGVAIAAAVVVGIVLATMGGGGKDDDTGPNQSPVAKVPIPTRQIADLEDAAKAAKCVLTHPPIEGSNHVDTNVKYKTNPPTSGDHVPPGQQASDGDYSGIPSPDPENYVHSLEHGRVIIQYKPGLPKRRVDQLLTLFAENSKTDFGIDSINGGFTLLMENNTKMTPEVAVTAWGHLLVCPKMNDQVFDAIRAFRGRYILQGPEKVTSPE